MNHELVIVIYTIFPRNLKYGCEFLFIFMLYFSNMKIYVIGSTTFVKDMVAYTDKLVAEGYDGWIHPEYRDYVADKNHSHLKRIEDGEHAKVKIENDYYFKFSAGSLSCVSAGTVSPCLTFFTLGNTTISTLRLALRPSTVSLESTGRYSP